MRVISLGWGVQSFALAAMSALGELPPVDAAIHSDTTHERSETYAFAEKWTPWLEERGVRVVTVKAKNTRPDARFGKTIGLRLPAYTRYPDGKQSGTLARQCTRDWKISPINRCVSAELKERGLKKTPGVVEQWLGITLDEIQRMKPSRVKYINLRFPFVEMFNPPMSRWQVVQWLNENGLGIPVKSSCVFCPYHDTATWREIKASSNNDWRRAVDVDERIRDKRPNFLCYVHRDRVPLVDVDMRSQQDHGQLSLWDEECEGYCFL